MCGCNKRKITKLDFEFEKVLEVLVKNGKEQ